MDLFVVNSQSYFEKAGGNVATIYGDIIEEYGYRFWEIIFSGTVEEFVAIWLEWLRTTKPIYRIAESPFAGFARKIDGLEGQHPTDLIELAQPVIVVRGHVHEEEDSFLVIDGKEYCL